MIQHLTLPVVAKESCGANYALLWIAAPKLAALCAPGMFFELKASDPLQRRKLYKPVSVYGVEDGDVGFLIKRIGSGTEALCALQAGDLLHLTGPLGNAFPLVENANVLLVSGGIGYPPIAYLKQALLPANRVIHLHGGACAADAFPCDVLYTDDGSAGIRGLVTAEIGGIIENNRIGTVYSCGPVPMLKALSAKVAGLKHYCSLEAYMACGIGACHGCAVGVGEGYQRVCKDGPVFDAATVRWEEL